MIHPRAHVSPDCKIHEAATVWQFASVTGGTILAAGVSVSPFAMLHGPQIGENTRISAGVAMGPGFLVGADVFIGPNVTVCNDAWPRAHKDGYEPGAFEREGKFAVVIEDGASIGANAVILPGVRVGARSMIAAGSVVTSDVPPGMLWKGDSWREMIGEGQRMRFAK